MWVRFPPGPILFFFMSFLNHVNFLNYKFVSPVGALTSKSYAFTARSWELETADSIDIFDTLNSNILVHIRGSRPMRVLPKVNDLLNEEWITDKVRLSFEGYSRQRLLFPMVKNENLLIPCSWEDAFFHFSQALQKFSKLSVFGGRLLDLETITALKDFSSVLGFERRFTSINFNLNVNVRSSYLCFTDLTSLTKVDFLLLFGCNLKIENPILNLYIRRLVRSGKLVVESIGFNSFNSIYTSSGTSVLDFFTFLEGRSLLSTRFFRFKNPFILIGYSALKLINLSVLENLGYQFAILHPFSGYVNACEVGFISLLNDSFTSNVGGLVFLVGSDDVLIDSADFIVYQGHNGFVGAAAADLIFPSTIFLEKTSYFLNNFGYFQQSSFTLTPSALVRVDYKILQALLFYILNNKISKVLLQFLNFPARLADYTPFLKNSTVNRFVLPNMKGSVSYLCNSYVESFIFDYYKTDSITSSSKTLALASSLRFQNFSNYAE
jgi:NADH dehydrogenase/NADH:ubiquinone oxidoreductase subunit G